MSKVNFIEVIENELSAKNKTIKINGRKIEVKTYIDAETYVSAIKTIVNNCFRDNEYHPEYFEIVRRYVMLSYFTNIDVENISLQEVFKTSQKGCWFYKIEKEIMSLPIWKCVEKSIGNCIENVMKSRKTSFDNLCDSFNSMVSDSANIDVNVINELNDRLKDVSDKGIIDKISSNRANNQ